MHPITISAPYIEGFAGLLRDELEQRMREQRAVALLQ
jgi:hypothetical protein